MLKPINHSYGYLKDKLDIRDYGIMRFIDTVTLPTQFNFVSSMLPVRDQCQTYSCTAFASSKMLDQQLSKKYGHSYMTSPKFIYDETGIVENDSSDNGRDLRDTFSVLSSKGAPPESDCPFNGGVNILQFQETSIMLADALPNRIQSYARLDTVNQIKQALIQNGAVVVGMPVYENWEGVEVDVSGVIPMPVGASIAGHALALCGWDDAMGWFIFENSWGEQWAYASKYHAGFGVIREQYVQDALANGLGDAWTGVEIVNVTPVTKPTCELILAIADKSSASGYAIKRVMFECQTDMN